eukprot:16129073-Heterocapsa_arctica.AAC.1
MITEAGRQLSEHMRRALSITFHLHSELDKFDEEICCRILPFPRLPSACETLQDRLVLAMPLAE